MRPRRRVPASSSKPARTDRSLSALAHTRPAGCEWDIYAADGCVPTQQTELALQFAYRPTDPLATLLTQVRALCWRLVFSMARATTQHAQHARRRPKLFAQRRSLTALPRFAH